jgi:hypothetical protein
MVPRLIRGGFTGLILMTISFAVILPGCSSKKSDKEVVSMKNLLPQQVLGWNLQDSVETYDRESIFDYIDGAGEVYLSYGFKEVNVFRYVKSGEPAIVVEVFDMGSAEDAYGVFSHSREAEEEGIGQGYEFRGSLLSFWQGRFFICILGESLTGTIKETIFALAGQVADRIGLSGGKPPLVRYLPRTNLKGNTVRYFHSYPMLNYHYFLAEKNILNLGSETRCVLAEYAPGSIHLLAIQYQSPEEASRSYMSFIDNYVPEARGTGYSETEGGLWVAAEQVGEFLIIVLEASRRDDALMLIRELKDKLLAESG